MNFCADEFVYDDKFTDEEIVCKKISENATNSDDEHDEVEKIDLDDWNEDDESEGFPDDFIHHTQTLCRYTSTGLQTMSNEISRTKTYAVLDVSHVKIRLVAHIVLLAESLSLSYDDAETLLCHYRWDTQTIQKVFLTTPNEIKNKAGVTSPTAELTLSSSTTTKLSKFCNTAFCGEVNTSKLFALSCGHLFCSSCWTGFIRSEFNAGRSCQFSKCPGNNEIDGKSSRCTVRIPSTVMKRYLNNEAYENYERWLIESFVLSNETIQWCTRPECSKAIESIYFGDVKCLCDNQFCFRCARKTHRPAPCDIVKKWISKSNADSETDRWIKARTKSCPKCSVRIEKNRACNHMICSNCLHQFCWLCKREWSEHDVETQGFYTCNIYNADKNQNRSSQEETDLTSSTRFLQKYIFYANRYQHQLQAHTETVKLQGRIEAFALTQHKEPSTLEFYDRLLSVIEALADSQKMLGWTYCLSYYIPSGVQKNLLEHQQGLLEVMSEKLAFMFDSISFEKLFDLNSSKARDKILRVGYSIRRFGQVLRTECESEDFELSLLDVADDSLNNWACTICTSENIDTASWCTACGACRTHGEQECRSNACRNPMTPAALTPVPQNQPAAAPVNTEAAALSSTAQVPH